MSTEQPKPKDQTAAFVDALIRDLNRPRRPPTWWDRMRSAFEWLGIALAILLAIVATAAGTAIFIGIVILVTSPLWAIGLLALWFVGWV